MIQCHGMKYFLGRQLKRGYYTRDNIGFEFVRRIDRPLNESQSGSCFLMNGFIS